MTGRSLSNMLFSRASSRSSPRCSPSAPLGHPQGENRVLYRWAGVAPCSTMGVEEGGKGDDDNKARRQTGKGWHLLQPEVLGVHHCPPTGGIPSGDRRAGLSPGAGSPGAVPGSPDGAALRHPAAPGGHCGHPRSHRQGYPPAHPAAEEDRTAASGAHGSPPRERGVGPGQPGPPPKRGLPVLLGLAALFIILGTVWVSLPEARAP